MFLSEAVYRYGRARQSGYEDWQSAEPLKSFNEAVWRYGTVRLLGYESCIQIRYSEVVRVWILSEVVSWYGAVRLLGYEGCIMIRYSKELKLYEDLHSVEPFEALSEAVYRYGRAICLGYGADMKSWMEDAESKVFRVWRLTQHRLKPWARLYTDTVQQGAKAVWRCREWGV